MAHDENMRIAEYNDLLQGVVGFGPSWHPWVTCFRGEAAQMLCSWMVKVGLTTPAEPALTPER